MNNEVNIAKKHYVNTRDKSLFSNHGYDLVALEIYFFPLLDQLTNREQITEHLSESYLGGENYGRLSVNHT